MKILTYATSINEFKMRSIINILYSMKYEIAAMHTEIDEDEIKKYNPDIIIHNVPNTEKIIDNKSVQINISTLDMDFIVHRPSDVLPIDKDKFSSDIVFFGNMQDFGKKIFRHISKNRYKLKFFHPEPVNIYGYCGLCGQNDYYRFYKNAKASISHINDLMRIKDILAAGGNPVILAPNKDDEFIDNIELAIKENKKFNVANMNRRDIINKDTAHDRLATIFNNAGLKRLAKEIIENKREVWEA